MATAAIWLADWLPTPDAQEWMEAQARALLLYARSNLHPSGGGRHVQLTRSRDGIGGWSRWVQLQIEGLAHGRQELNIYFWSIQDGSWIDVGGVLGGPFWQPKGIRNQ